MQKPVETHRDPHAYPNVLLPETRAFSVQSSAGKLKPKAPLLLLAKNIPWDLFEREFASLYSRVGRRAKPIRLMMGLLLFEQMKNLSDERVVEDWVQKRLPLAAFPLE